MSAGSGFLHQEMPKRTEGMLSGFELWVNLPRDDKLETPAYRGVESREIPIVRGEDGRAVRVIAGEDQGVLGPFGTFRCGPALPRCHPAVQRRIRAPGQAWPHDVRPDD